MTDRSDSLLAAHLDLLQQRWEQALANTGFQVAVVAAGKSVPYLFDDQMPTFRANPHLAQWLGSDACEGSVLVVEPGATPRLLFLSEADYWHQPPQPPERLGPQVNISVLASSHALDAELNRCIQHCERIAYVGAAELPWATLGAVNPPSLINALNYQRAFKTSYEVQCMRAASAKAVAGHRAVADAFAGGASEFELQLVYLSASQQTEADLPYPNIVAQNAHAGILHYQHYARTTPAKPRCLLIDAGARHANYAADITRTHTQPHVDAAQQTYNGLVRALDAEQQALIDGIAVGQNFLALHERMHERVAGLLVAAELVSCSADSAFETGITRTFLPHGLGHLIGLQTHDVGGHQANPAGTVNAPPEDYPSLRLTRTIEAGQAFTVEPGIYFIPQLLDALRNEPGGRNVRWAAVDALREFGGIRIEDNVVVTDRGIENLTRDAFGGDRTTP